MGCGSSRNANDTVNATLAAHLSSVLGLDAVSDDVARYVQQLRSEGFDAPEDLAKLSGATLEAFNFKQGHLLKMVESQKNPSTMGCGSSRNANDTVNATLAAHLASVLGLDAVSDDVARYVQQLRSEGFDAPEDLAKLSGATLEAFNFKQGHLLKMVESQKKIAYSLAKAKKAEANDKINAALADHLASILGLDAVSDDVALYVAQLRSEGCDTPRDLDALRFDNQLADEPFNFKRLHLKKIGRS